MAEEVPRYDCHCCKPQCAAVPTWELDPCGFALATGDFDPSVQPDIPAAATTMRWLGKTRALIRDGKATHSDADQIYYRDTYSGVIARDIKVPESGCSDSQTIEGSATSFSQDDIGATFNVSGPATFNGSTAIIQFSGTDFAGDPVSYDENIPAEFPGIDPNEAVPVYSLNTDDLRVTQTRIRTWNYTDTGTVPEQTFTGNDAQDFGYDTPFFRCKVTIPNHLDIKFMEVEWMCQIQPEEGEAYDLSIRRFTWREGDDREVQQIEAYTEIGEITLKGMRWRCTPIGHWQAAPADFAIEAWPDSGIGINGNEGNDNGLYLTYGEN